MSRLVNGHWQVADELAENSVGGDRLLLIDDEFLDAPATLVSGTLESGRYHLIVSLACPWAQRTLIARNLLGMGDALSHSVVDPIMRDDGWTMHARPYARLTLLRDLYVLSKPDYTGKVTVPVLWDTIRNQTVNNNSLDICRRLAAIGRDRVDLHPSALRPAVDALLEELNINLFIAVYQAGFAVDDQAYDSAVARVFSMLDRLEKRLTPQAYLFGNNVTLADICLFTALIRFDPVYNIHFRCNQARLRDFPNLHAYVHRLAAHPAFAETISLPDILAHYYRSHLRINPGGGIPDQAHEGF